MFDEINYASETILLGEVFQVLSEFNKSEGLEKYAFDLASVLPSIGNWVSSHTGEQFRENPDGILRTMENLLVPGIAFGIHPLLGILVSVAEHYGFDLVSVYDKIKNAILPNLKEGKQVSADQINSAAQSAMPTIAEEPPGPDSGNVDDLLLPLRAMRAEGRLTKEAIFGKESQKKWDTKGNWFNPLKGLLDLFSARKKANIIVGLLAWFVKTILLSAGLLGIAGMVLPNKNPITGQAPNNTTTQNSTIPVSNTSNIPQSTGAGSFVFKKGPDDRWVEDLNGLQPHEMVLDWAVKSYPSLNQYKNIILSTPSFWNAVKSVTSTWRPGQSDIDIPDPYKSRDDVVKLFVNDVFNTINEGRK